MFLKNSFAQPIDAREEECQFHHSELLEQCALEHIEYRLAVEMTITLKAVIRTGCSE